MNPTTHDLATRLARVEGQIAALRRTLETGADTDCVKTLTQVKAASAGLKRFAEALSRSYAKRCVAEKKSPGAFARDLDTIISSAYSLS